MCASFPERLKAFAIELLDASPCTTSAQFVGVPASEEEFPSMVGVRNSDYWFGWFECIVLITAIQKRFSKLPDSTAGFGISTVHLSDKLFLGTVALCESGITPQLRGDFRRHSLSGVRNARNNAALHKAEIAVASHKAAEIE
jgi:hypothetical protein